MKNKKLLTPIIAKNYYKYISDINQDEINLLLSILNENEKKRVYQYKKTLCKHLTNERLFLYICNIIDFYTIKHEK